MSLDVKFSDTVLPTSDFYLYVNQNWKKENQIPEDFQKWGIFNILSEENRKLEKKILESLTFSENSENNSLKILYNQGLNINEIDKLKPKDYLKLFFYEIDNCKTKEDLLKLYAKYNIKYGLNSPFKFNIYSDFNNSNFNILHIFTGGLGLPDRDYYFKDDKKEIREKYVKFIESYSKLFDLDLDANLIFSIEKNLALKTHTKVEQREPSRLNNPHTYEIIESRYNSIPIKFLFEYLKKEHKQINISNPNFFDFFEEMWNSINIDSWKKYLKWILILEFSSYFNENVSNEFFKFYGTALSGTPKNLERWKRVLILCNQHLGEVLGKIFISKYFPESSKMKAKELVDYIKKEVKIRLTDNEWMQDSTKEKAIEKLEKMNVKIGYPDVFEDYRKLNLSLKNSFFENNLLCLEFNSKIKFKKLYTKKDLNKWFMNPHKVNAYYSPTYNEIVFPAGILQKPFFSEDYDMALNFGGIGTVIGHEITHGFDDKGRKFDSDGNLKDWWTEIDAIKFKEKTKKIRDQYASYQIEGKNINGDLTLGENIADIGGVSISYYSLQRYLKDHPNQNKVIDGLTPNQRFFINYSRIWASNTREKETLNKLTIDPHSPPIFRVNGVLSNLKEFYDAFDVKETDKMWKSENERANVW